MLGVPDLKAAAQVDGSPVPHVQSEAGGQLAGLTGVREPRLEVFGIELWLDGALLGGRRDGGKGEGQGPEALGRIIHIHNFSRYTHCALFACMKDALL